MMFDRKIRIAALVPMLLALTTRPASAVTGRVEVQGTGRVGFEGCGREPLGATLDLRLTSDTEGAFSLGQGAFYGGSYVTTGKRKAILVLTPDPAAQAALAALISRIASARSASARSCSRAPSAPCVSGSTSPAPRPK